MGERLARGFDGDPLENPAKGELDPFLKAVRKALPAGGPLVALWSGHGHPSSLGGLRLLTRDASDPAVDGIAAGELMAAAVRSGANQVLLILDTCYSAAANVDVAGVALTLMQDRPPEGQHVWVGVLAACSPLEKARDGLLAKALCDLLDRGPSSPELRVHRWSAHNRLIRGDDLCDALVKEWGSDAQTPQFLGTGSAWFMIPNPLYRADAPLGVVEHLLRAARGGAAEDELSAFTGRTVEVDQVVEWVASGVPGVHVVTGPAGTGKSAIVGRVVSVADPAERARLAVELGGQRWGHTDPGEGSVDAHVHARGLTVDRVAELLDGQLVGRGLLPLSEGGRHRNAALLVGALQQRAETGTPRTPVIVLDGLDEARGQAFTITDDLLSRVARFATVVVATREVPAGGPEPSLIERLAPHGPGIDLGDPGIAERALTDLRGYVTRRLAGRAPEMDPQVVAEQFTTGMRGHQPFLLARIVTDQLRANPLDTGRPGWQDAVAASFEDAFHTDLAGVTAPSHRHLPDTMTPAELAGHLLATLTWAYGAGFPEEEWLAAAAALAPVIDLGRDDITWVLEQAGRYIVQDGEAGAAVYRIAHQSLADLLHSRHAANADQPFDPRALPITTALTDRYRALLEGGVPAPAAGYLWRYLWRHAAAGPAGVDLLRDLALVDADLVPDVPLAALDVAATYRSWGRRQEAVAPTEEAVATYRELAVVNPAFLPDLAM
ncbi:MAG TPA: ATP-binding protein, partial [Kineosporiaceae bacterium]|nr:ATP-binding protein [Kineosporiaceae bacterium]